MKKVSITLMAHPSRKDLVLKLQDQLGLSSDQIVWDRKNDRWDTGRRAWEAHDPSADYHLVIQDDALACRDLLPGLERAADHLPAKAISSLYIGTRRPLAHKVERVVTEARAVRPSWIVMPALNWGVAIMAPTFTIEDMLPWCDRQDYPNYDRRVGRYYLEVLRWPTWCTWPSLVDHYDGESLCGHGQGRKAHEFIGEDASALDVDFGGPVLTMGKGIRGLTPEQREAATSRLRRELIARKEAKKARLLLRRIQRGQGS